VSDLVNCAFCQGQGRKMMPNGSMVACWSCRGTRKKTVSFPVTRSRYDQNCRWKSFSMSNDELAEWALHKRIERLERQRQIHARGATNYGHSQAESMLNYVTQERRGAAFTAELYYTGEEIPWMENLLGTLVRQQNDIEKSEADLTFKTPPWEKDA